MSSAIRSRPDSIALIGGHPALDLVNTVSWRHDPERRRENLAAPADLITWAQRVALLKGSGTPGLHSAVTDADPETARRALDGVHALREALYRHLVTVVDRPEQERVIRPGSKLHRAFVDAIGAGTLAGAPVRSVGTLAGTPVRWALPLGGPVDLTRLLALQALDLVQTMAAERLRRCENDGCGWLFLDATRNHSRRWCSSGDCGNRDRVRRHYARTRSGVS